MNIAPPTGGCSLGTHTGVLYTMYLVDALHTLATPPYRSFINKFLTTTIAVVVLTSLSMSLAYSQPLTNGLVAHYSFNIDAYDKSGNQYDGVNVRATFVDQWTYNGAFDFNRATNHISLPDSLATDLDGLNAITVSA